MKTVRILILLITAITVIGCSHFTEDRAVICKVECTNCEHVAHECNGTNVKLDLAAVRFYIQ